MWILSDMRGGSSNISDQYQENHNLVKYSFREKYITFYEKRIIVLQMYLR